MKKEQLLLRIKELERALKPFAEVGSKTRLFGTSSDILDYVPRNDCIRAFRILNKNNRKLETKEEQQITKRIKTARIKGK